MYSIAFDEGAYSDIDAHATYYEKELTGLGKKFIAETFDLVDLIKLNPKLFAERFKGTRTAVYKKFPYLLYYLLDGDNIIILSVMPAAMAVKKHKKAVVSRKKNH